MGISALHFAAKNNFYDTCATLLRSGISKDAKTKVDRTPLHFAVFEGNFEICQLLIQYECSIDVQDILKMTPLHWAVDRGFDNIAQLLLENGADPYVTSKFLKTPYKIAKEKNNNYIVKLIEMLPNLEAKSSLNFDTCFSKKNDPESKHKRDRNHSSSAPDVVENTLQLLKEQMNMMTANNEGTLIESAIQSGRKIMLSEAGRRLLNDSNLNQFLKIPLNTTISPTSVTPSPRSNKRSSESPRSATITSRRTSESSDILEVYRENTSAFVSGAKKTKSDILDVIRSDEVTITHRLKSVPLPSPSHKSSISLSAISQKCQPKSQKQQGQNTNILPSLEDAIKNSNTKINDADFTQKDTTDKMVLELSNNFLQMKRLFEKEQLKTATLQRQFKQLEVNFEVFKRQQNEKFETIINLLTKTNRRIENKDNLEANGEIL